MRAKKLFKILGISIALSLVVSSLGFATFVYNPFEGEFDEIRKAVPLGVDFFVAKKDLGADFSDFPTPNAWEQVEAGTSWQRVRNGAFYKDAARQLQPLLDQIDRVESELKTVPVVGLDILTDGIGADLAVAGKRRGGSSDFDLCVYSRVSWKIRAAIGLLAYDSVRKSVAGLTITPEKGAPGVYRLDGNMEPAWLTRVQDLLIAGNSKELVTESRDLATGVSTADAIFQSADYNDLLATPLSDWGERVGQDPNAITGMVDMAVVRHLAPDFANWPGPGADLPIEGRLMDPFITQSSWRHLWSSVVFDAENALSLIARLRINHGELTEFQKSFHGEKQGSRDDWLRPFLAMVPSTAAFTAAVRIPPTVLLEEMFHALDNDSRELFENAVRSSNIKTGVRGLIGRIATALQPWVGLVFRNNNYRELDLEFPVPIKSPAPAVALVFRVMRGQERVVDDFIELFRKSLRFPLGFSAKELLFKAGLGNEVSIKEWGNPQIAGTGELAMFWDGKGHRRYYIVSTSGKLLGEIVNARYRLRGVKPLLSDKDVADCMSTLPRTLSAFAWVNGNQVLNILSRYTTFAKRRLDEGMTVGWQSQVRQDVENAVFDAHFRNRFKTKADIPRGKEEKKFSELINTEMTKRWQIERKRRNRDDDEDFGQWADFMAYLHAGYFTLRATPKELSLETRLFLK